MKKTPSSAWIISFHRPDSIQLNLGFSRSWFQTPNSYDATYGSAWYGVVTDASGVPSHSPDAADCVIAACSLTVGPTDQRSQIRTFNIAPTWTHLFSSSTVYTLGAFVRHDQYNYYPSTDPFADLAPTDLQRETVSQLRFLTNAASSLGRFLREGHPQRQSGSHRSAHLPHGK